MRFLRSQRITSPVLAVLIFAAGAANAEFPPLPEGAFSIVALPDTQQHQQAGANPADGLALHPH